MKKWIVVLLAAAVYYVANRPLQDSTVSEPESGTVARGISMLVAEAPRAEAPSDQAPSVQAPPSQTFSCDGRTYCSQMSSCAEARYFLANCPNTKMDGDNDGIPCESQWCG